MSGGFGYLNAPPAFFPSSSIPSWARPFGCSWALSPRRRSFGCGGKLLYRHGTVRQSRAASLLRVFDAHRGRAAPGRLTLPVGHGLSTHDADASAVVDAPSPSFGGAASFSWLWLPRCASGVFSYPRVVLRGLALSGVHGLCVLDAVVVAAVGDCYIVMLKVMVWIGSLSQLRCFALSGAHRGRAAPGRLTPPDGRGLSTPDTAASAAVHGSLSDAWRGSYVVHHGRCRRVVERNGVRSRRFVARRHHTISFAPSQCSRGAHCPGMEGSL